MKDKPIQHTLKEELIIRSIKLLDIGWATTIYFIAAALSVFTIDKYVGKFNNAILMEEPTEKLIVKSIFYIWGLGILAYIMRNTIPLIPFPLDGICGFDHYRVNEVKTSALFMAAFVGMDSRIKGMYQLLQSRV